MKSYHVEILDEDGEIITLADVSVAKVGDIRCVRSADFVGILVDGQTVATGYLTVARAKQDTFTATRTPLEGGEPIEVKVER